jgi:hypothetical protein
LRFLHFDRRPLADEDARPYLDPSGDERSDTPDARRHSFTLPEVTA